MRNVLLTLVAVFALSTGAAGAQETGGYIARIGKDTLAIETYGRTTTSLVGRSLLRSGGMTAREYNVSFRPDGSVARYVVRTYQLPSLKKVDVTYTDRNGNSYASAAAYMVAPPADPARVVTQTFEYGTDSVTITTQQGEQAPRRITVAAAGNPLPFSENLFAPWMETVRRSGTIGSVAFLTGRSQLKYNIERPAKDRMILNGVGQDFGPMLIQLDAQGRMKQLDMRATTDKYLVDHVSSIDFDGLAFQFAKNPLGALSPRDTVRAAVGEAHIAIDYSKPSARGRKVFGGMAPWGEVWRAGADQATQLITDRDLDFNGTIVPAGTYSLFVIPSEDGQWQLIINRQKGQWGTVYDKAQDLVRIPVKVAKTPSHTEQMQFTIDPSSKSGAIGLAWENSRIIVPFTVR